MARGMPAALLKKRLASRALLRRNSYKEPCAWLVPDFDENVMTPPEACPYSALKPLVSTANSVTASSEGAFEETQLCDSARVVLAETPSSVVPYPAAWPPPRMKPLSPPRFFDSGVSTAR